MRILVADDDWLSRLLLQSAVEELSFESVVAADGDQAWKLFRETSPEVVITDRLMPGIDGIEAVSRHGELASAVGLERVSSDFARAGVALRAQAP